MKATMKNPKNNENILMVAASEADANLYYATRFLVGDPIVFMQVRGKKHLLMNDLELDRARAQAKVDRVHSISKLAAEYKEQTGKRPSYLDLIEELARREKAQEFVVPGNFPLEFADPLRQRGLKLEMRPEPFFEERMQKSKEEVAAVRKAIRHTEDAIAAAVAVLRKSVPRKGKLYYHGNVLTSDEIRKVINVKLMEDNCVAQNSIVACGIQCVDPHNRGNGPLYANQSIIMDIFPRDAESRYHADITRTVVRGKASPKLKKMFQAVRDGQEIAFKTIREGADGAQIHGAIEKLFQDLGFKTGVINGRVQGFFHGTGHGLGLDIHESPRISRGKDILKAGQIVTVEPGLYYEDAGGIRIEDDVLVTKTGCEILSKLERRLEI
jgi:Xaa-Pro aminopeptidase